MDKDTRLRLRQMLSQYQRELLCATDECTIERLKKLIDDAERQLNEPA